jgi:hypothetical protein
MSAADVYERQRESVGPLVAFYPRAVGAVVGGGGRCGFALGPLRLRPEGSSGGITDSSPTSIIWAAGPMPGSGGHRKTARDRKSPGMCWGVLVRRKQPWPIKC